MEVTFLIELVDAISISVDDIGSSLDCDDVTVASVEIDDEKLLFSSVDDTCKVTFSVVDKVDNNVVFRSPEEKVEE